MFTACDPVANIIRVNPRLTVRQHHDRQCSSINQPLCLVARCAQLSGDTEQIEKLIVHGKVLPGVVSFVGSVIPSVRESS